MIYIKQMIRPWWSKWPLFDEANDLFLLKQMTTPCWSKWPLHQIPSVCWSTRHQQYHKCPPTSVRNLTRASPKTWTATASRDSDRTTEWTYRIAEMWLSRIFTRHRVYNKKMKRFLSKTVYNPVTPIIGHGRKVPRGWSPPLRFGSIVYTSLLLIDPISFHRKICLALSHLVPEILDLKLV